MNDQKIHWTLKRFDQLTPAEVYEILKLRQEVFILEQNCIYQDVDGLDQTSLHLSGRMNDELALYLRLVPPGRKFEEPSIGRIVVRQEYRGNRLGQKLVKRGLATIQNRYPKQTIRIEAQLYLESFYKRLGFETVSEEYDLDGIPHIQMVINLPLH